MFTVTFTKSYIIKNEITELFENVDIKKQDYIEDISITILNEKAKELFELNIEFYLTYKGINLNEKMIQKLINDSVFELEIRIEKPKKFIN